MGEANFAAARGMRVLFAALAVSVAVSVAVSAAAAPAVWSFNTDKLGDAPAGFEFAVTAGRQPGRWVVARDGANQVLAQTDRDKTARRFAMALVKDASYKDLKVSVKAKPIAGEVEMVAGLVWRYRDAENYYVARWNADSVRVDRVVGGERQLLTPTEIKAALPANRWHTLTVQHRGDELEVFVGDKRVFAGKDSTYQNAGKVGVWVKADSLTHFDDLTVQALE